MIKHGSSLKNYDGSHTLEGYRHSLPIIRYKHWRYQKGLLMASYIGMHTRNKKGIMASYIGMHTRNKKGIMASYIGMHTRNKKGIMASYIGMHTRNKKGIKMRMEITIGFDD